MKQLVVLSLSNYRNIAKLPNSIGNLIYLRYLNLSHTSIERLPSETCKLYNLQTLLLSCCYSLTELPKDMGKLVNLQHLDIRGTQLNEIPVQILKLENLQTLSDFFVTYKDTGLKIADMGKYSHLRGSLFISMLDNVTDPSHVFQANLMLKNQIDELVLRWCYESVVHSQIQSAVLEQLRPSTNLKNLTIFGYGGNNFPNWLGDSLFDNMVCLKISFCDKCSRLPPLGQLGSLKKLFIAHMKSVNNIAVEFYGSGSPLFQPFPLLETLEFDTMLEWKEWKLTGGTSTEFPRLTRLSLQNCPKLKGNIPLGQLSNLKELCIEGMNSVKTLGIEFYGSSNSPLFQPFLSLETLQFRDMQEWEEWKLIGGTTTEFPSLARLSLYNCPKLKGNIPGNHPSLTSLSLEYCLKLKGMAPKNLPSLRELELRECPLLMESRHSDDKSNITITIPSSDVFSELMLGLNSLRKITFKDIPSLTSIPRDSLPKTLQSLIIWNCGNLEFIPYEFSHSYKSLENLEISDSCNSMTSFTLGFLPFLQTLYICNCKNLKSILIAEDTSQHNLLFLRTVQIRKCDELESISLGGFPIPSLVHLSVCECKKLRSLPEPTNTLGILQNVEIRDLPNLQYFPIDDLPISLRELSVYKVGGILWNATWERLTSLSVLHIKGDDLVKAMMKMEVPLLPTSLVSLTISLEDIECLDGKWLQHLTALQKLKIADSPKLKSLPEKGKLPSSLKVLRISDRPLLKEICRRNHGKEWRKISHIPFIFIGMEIIT